MIAQAAAIRKLRRIQALKNFIASKQVTRERAGLPVNGYAVKEVAALAWVLEELFATYGISDSDLASPRTFEEEDSPAPGLPAGVSL